MSWPTWVRIGAIALFIVGVTVGALPGREEYDVVRHVFGGLVVAGGFFLLWLALNDPGGEGVGSLYVAVVVIWIVAGMGTVTGRLATGKSAVEVEPIPNRTSHEETCANIVELDREHRAMTNEFQKELQLEDNPKLAKEWQESMEELLLLNGC